MMRQKLHLKCKNSSPELSPGMCRPKGRRYSASCKGGVEPLQSKVLCTYASTIAGRKLMNSRHESHSAQLNTTHLSAF